MDCIDFGGNPFRFRACPKGHPGVTTQFLGALERKAAWRFDVLHAAVISFSCTGGVLYPGPSGEIGPASDSARYRLLPCRLTRTSTVLVLPDAAARSLA
jgi:hypothetical protein